jgi:Flp pilus assembly protein TadD
MNTPKTNRIPLRVLCIAGACAAMSLTANAGDRFILETHSLRTPGVRDIESGHYERGVATLESQLQSGRASPATRASVLIDLCVGYAMLHRLDAAAQACDAAVESKWHHALASNNRGVVNMLRGRHEPAVRDFNRAVTSEVAYQTARTNLKQAVERVAAIERQRDQAMFAAATDITDVSTAAVAARRGAER